MRAALAALVIVASFVPAGAQPRLIISGQGQAAGAPSATMSFDLGTQQVEWFYPTPWLDVAITGDGRYVFAWPVLAATDLWIYDLATGALKVVPLGGHVLKTAVAHTRRVELFALMTDGLVAGITFDGVRPLFTCEDARGLDLSGDNRRLALVCASKIVIADADSGAEIARLPVFDEMDSPILNVDGSQVVVRWRNMTAFRHDLALVEVATGRLLLHAITPPLNALNGEAVSRVLAATPARDAILVTTDSSFMVGWYAHRSLLVDFTTLTIRQNLPLVGRGACRPDIYPGECPEPFDVVFTADGRYVIAGTRDTVVGLRPTAAPAMVQLVDLPSNTLLASTGADFFASGGLSLALASAPLAPANLAATVAGRDVTLSWSLLPTSPGVTGYVVEAGSAPGLANLAVLCVSGDQRSLTVSGVPPGRYVVRVRARNVTGTSGPSNEIMVEVP